MVRCYPAAELISSLDSPEHLPKELPPPLRCAGSKLRSPLRELFHSLPLMPEFSLPCSCVSPIFDETDIGGEILSWIMRRWIRAFLFVFRFRSPLVFLQTVWEFQTGRCEIILVYFSCGQVCAGAGKRLHSSVCSGWRVGFVLQGSSIRPRASQGCLGDATPDTAEEVDEKNLICSPFYLRRRQT